MKIKVTRKQGNKEFTEGKMYVNDIFECYTVEDADRKLESGGSKIQNKTAIPKGIYKVTWNHSNHFNKDMPQILNVPGFEGVRIHAGNDSGDTEGCIIVGAVNDNMDDDYIGGSVVARDRLYIKIKKAFLAGEKITIEIA